MASGGWEAAEIMRGLYGDGNIAAQGVFTTVASVACSKWHIDARARLIDAGIHMINGCQG